MGKQEVSYDPQFQDNPPWLRIVLLLPADAARQCREVKALGSRLRATGMKDLQELDLRSKLTNPKAEDGFAWVYKSSQGKEIHGISGCSPDVCKLFFLILNIRTIDSTYDSGCFDD